VTYVPRHEILRFSQQLVLKLVFWDVNMCQQCGGTCYFCSEDGDCLFLLNIVNYLSNCMKSYPRRLDSWCANFILHVNLVVFVFDVCNWHHLSFHYMMGSSIRESINHVSTCYGICWELSFLDILFPWPSPCVWMLISCQHNSAVAHMSLSVEETTGWHSGSNDYA
jgi:hypothetical protein